jgi:hypothetical protein
LFTHTKPIKFCLSVCASVRSSIAFPVLAWYYFCRSNRWWMVWPEGNKVWKQEIALDCRTNVVLTSLSMMEHENWQFQRLLNWQFFLLI